MYLKASNSLHTTQISTFEYLFISFSKTSDAIYTFLIVFKINIISFLEKENILF